MNDVDTSNNDLKNLVLDALQPVKVDKPGLKDKRHKKFKDLIIGDMIECVFQENETSVMNNGHKAHQVSIFIGVIVDTFLWKGVKNPFVVVRKNKTTLVRIYSKNYLRTIFGNKKINHLTLGVKIA